MKNQRDAVSKKNLLKDYKERKITGGVYAIVNVASGKRLIQSTNQIEKAPNLFAFSQSTGSCVHPLLSADWKKEGPAGFSLEILETLDKNDTQSDKEFLADIRFLEELWKEKADPEKLY